MANASVQILVVDDEAEVRALLRKADIDSGWAQAVLGN